MATEFKLRGGTTAEHATFTGAAREATVDTDKNTIVVHDGQTQGGFALIKEESLGTAPDEVPTNADLRVDTIADLLSLDTSRLRDGQTVLVGGFSTVGDGGGGILCWDENGDQSDHNGGTVIDPGHSVEPGDSGWWDDENSGNGVWKRSIPGRVFASWFGMVDGFSDYSDAINAAVSFDINLCVELPRGRWNVKKTILVPEGVWLKGQGRGAQNLDAGTTLRSDEIPEGSPVVSLEGRSCRLSDLRITNIVLPDFDMEGVQVSGSFDQRVERVSVRNMVGTAFLIVPGCFSYVFDQCRAEGSVKIGFDIGSSTSAEFRGCLTFTSEIGFHVRGAQFGNHYTTFTGCGHDGPGLGYKLEGNVRGVSFIGCGVEASNFGGWEIDNSQAQSGVSIITPMFTQPGSDFGDGDAVIKVKNRSVVTIQDFDIASVFTPNGAKFLDTSEADEECVVSVINGRVFGNWGDLDKATFINCSDLNNPQRLFSNNTTVQSFPFPQRVDQSVDAGESVEMGTLSPGQAVLAVAKGKNFNSPQHGAVSLLLRGSSDSIVETIWSELGEWSVDGDGKIEFTNTSSAVNNRFYISIVPLTRGNV